MAQNEQAFKYAKQPVINFIKIKSSAMSEYIDITALVEQFNIYEDLFAPFVQGDLTIIDGLALITKLPILGQERIIISYRSSFIEDDIILEFDTYRVSGVSENGDDKSQVYTIYFSSPEAIQTRKRKLSRSYDDTHDNIVKKIYDNYIKVDTYEETPDKKLTILEPCEDDEIIVFPAWNPIKCIQWIAGRCRSASNINDCTYLFYERPGEGFFFGTLSQLTDQPTKFKYFRTNPEYATPDGQKDVILPILTMDTYVVDNDHNTMSAMQDGRYGGSLNFHDPLTRTYDTKFYDFSRDYQKISHIEQYRPTNSHTEREFGLKDMSVLFYPIMDQRMGGSKDHGIDVYLQRNAQLSQYATHMVNISVPGNSSLHVGDIVEIDVPAKEAPRDQEKGTDLARSGKYLVRSIRHQVSANKEYTSFISLIRDSASVEYSDIVTLSGGGSPRSTFQT